MCRSSCGNTDTVRICGDNNAKKVDETVLGTVMGTVLGRVLEFVIRTEMNTAKISEENWRGNNNQIVVQGRSRHWEQ